MPTFVFNSIDKTISTRTGYPPAAVYSDMATDSLYIKQGATVVKIEAGALNVGRWKSKQFVFNTYPSFGWARLNADFSGPMTLRVYGDGALRHTAVINSKDPVRLPAGRFKTWELELEGSARVTSLCAAHTVRDLIT